MSNGHWLFNDHYRHENGRYHVRQHERDYADGPGEVVVEHSVPSYPTPFKGLRLHRTLRILTVDGEPAPKRGAWTVTDADSALSLGLSLPRGLTDTKGNWEAALRVWAKTLAAEGWDLTKPVSKPGYASGFAMPTPLAHAIKRVAERR